MYYKIRKKSAFDFQIFSLILKKVDIVLNIWRYSQINPFWLSSMKIIRWDVSYKDQIGINLQLFVWYVIDLTTLGPKPWHFEQQYSVLSRYIFLFKSLDKPQTLDPCFLLLILFRVILKVKLFRICLRF